MKLHYTHRSSCRLCDDTNVRCVFQLESTPPANAFVKKEDINRSQSIYPLKMYFCEKCFHLQLLDILDPHELFENYVYVSGTSPLFVKHFEKYAEFIIKNYLYKSSFIVDIGSNDGTLLEFFKKNGHSVLGIDPAKNISKRATERGIETLPIFFDKENAQKIADKYGHVDIITANNVFAHIDDLSSFVQNVRDLLSNDGIFVFEVSYLLDVIENTLFDMIYHEHVSYHSILPLISFFEANEMQIIEIIKVDTHGGSIRGIVQKKSGPYKISKSLRDMIQNEKNKKLDKIETFQKFFDNIEQRKLEFISLIDELKSKNKTLAGYGAPAKATTLMYHFGIGPETIDFIVDDSTLKQGLYTPGKHIPILSPEIIYEKKPNYLIILSWNFAESIMKKHDKYKKIGHFIIPLPKLQVD